ncbi:hypothetical protein [Cellulomonas sp.]|uniref:hypothetical protein n=1 Tax=Cellulomonas sp. TaxID=40001 RepID=UPI003BAC9F3C
MGERSRVVAGESCAAQAQWCSPFVAILQSAASYGMHLVLGLTRWSELRMAHQSLFGTRLELRLNDPSESSIDRRLSETISDQAPGRVLLDDKRFAQVALPVLDVVPDDDVGAELELLALAHPRGPDQVQPPYDCSRLW